jgi:hypothetical protein
MPEQPGGEPDRGPERAGAVVVVELAIGADHLDVELVDGRRRAVPLLPGQVGHLVPHGRELLGEPAYWRSPPPLVKGYRQS